MSQQITAGDTAPYAYVTVLDSAGAPKSGVAYTGVTIRYAVGSTVSTLGLSAGTLGTWVSGGWYALGGGRYAVGLPTALVATAGTRIDVSGDYATGGIVPTTVRVDATVGSRSTYAGADTDTIAEAVLAAGDVDGFGLESALRLILAALAGKLSGAAGDSISIRAVDDSKNRITATVDSSGNRTAVVVDAS